MFSVGRLPSWLSLDTPVGGWIKVRKGWHLDGCKREQASGELRPGCWRWMGGGGLWWFALKWQLTAAERSADLKRFLQSEKKAASNCGACTHSSQPTLFQIYTGEKKQANKEVKSHLFQKCENISQALFFFICSSMAVSLCCQVTRSSEIQLFSIFFANCIVSSNKYGNGFLQARILENTARFTAYPNPHMKSPSNTQNWWI